MTKCVIAYLLTSTNSTISHARYQSRVKNKNLNSLIVHLDFTPAETSALLNVLITECGCDSSQVDLSYSSARKFHEEKVHEIAMDIKFEYDIQLPTRSPLGSKNYGSK